MPKTAEEKTAEDIDKQRGYFLSKFGFAPNPYTEEEMKQFEEEPEKEDEASTEQTTEEKEEKTEEQKGQEGQTPEEESESKKETEEEEKVTETEKEAEEKTESPSKAKKQTRSAKSERKAPPPPAYDDDAIRRAAEAAAEAAYKRQEEPQSPETDGKSELDLQGLNLDDNEQYRLQVLQEMEDNPENKGIAKKTVDFWRKEQDYIDEWKSKNPDSEFDPDGEEHKNFYRRNQPSLDSKQYREAEKRLKAKEVQQAAREVYQKEYAPVLQRLQRREKMEELKPKMQTNAETAITDFVKKASPEAAKIIGDNPITKETVDKLKEADETLYEILDENSDVVGIVSGEIDKLENLRDTGYELNQNLKVQLKNGDTVYPHREIVQFNEWLEDYLANEPEEEQIRDGKKFLRFADYQERVSNIQNSSKLSKLQKESALRDLDKRYWVVDADDLRYGFAAHMAAKTNRQIERLKKYSEKRGKPSSTEKGKTTPTNENEEGQQPGKKPQKTASKPPSPSVSASSDKTTTQKSGSSGAALTSDLIDQKMGWS